MSEQKKRNWIFLRGLAREARHWGTFVEQFQKAFPQDQIITVDLPGVGENKNEISPKSIHGMMKKVRKKAVQKIDKNEFYLFATSLGGMVALDWMSSYPNEIQKAVIINTSSRKSPFYQRFRWEIWKDFIVQISQTDLKKREEGILNIISNSPERRKIFLPLWVKLANEQTVPLRAALIQFAAASRFSPPEISLKGKVLFLVSLGDRLVEPRCTMDLAQLTQSSIRKHPWGGHDLTIDDPEWVLNEVEFWLKE